MPKPASLADTYVEPTDEEWQAEFMAMAQLRKERLDMLARNRFDPTLVNNSDFLAEEKEQLEEAFTYFLGLPPEGQARCARQFRNGLVKLNSLRGTTIWREFLERTLRAEEVE